MDRVYADGHEALEAFRDHVDEAHEMVTLGGVDYHPSQVWEDVDPVAFQLAFRAWLDSMECVEKDW